MSASVPSAGTRLGTRNGNHARNNDHRAISRPNILPTGLATGSSDPVIAAIHSGLGIEGGVFGAAMVRPSLSELGGQTVRAAGGPLQPPPPAGTVGHGDAVG